MGDSNQAPPSPSSPGRFQPRPPWPRPFTLDWIGPWRGYIFGASKVTKIPLRLRPIPFKVRLSLNRIRQYLKSSSELLTASFTIVLAVATVMLVGTAIKQHYDTVDAIRATNRFAKAAEASAIAMKRFADASEAQASATRQLVLDGELNSAEQASLTRESNRISRESFASVQRAFITVTDVSVSRGNPDRYPGGIQQSKFWMIGPIIENSGNTPTEHLRWMNALSVTLNPEQDADKVAVDIEKKTLPPIPLRGITEYWGLKQK